MPACAPVVCVFVCLLDALVTQEVHKCCRVFNRFNAPLMNISNCHFATASGFWLWTQTRGFGFGFGFACFALAICGQFAGNRRQPVNWKVSCNYKTFFIILWHFLLLLSASSAAAAASPAAVDILSLYAYNFGQVAGGEQMFLPQVARQSGLRL